MEVQRLDPLSKKFIREKFPNISVLLTFTTHAVYKLIGRIFNEFVAQFGTNAFEDMAESVSVLEDTIAPALSEAFVTKHRQIY